MKANIVLTILSVMMVMACHSHPHEEGKDKHSHDHHEHDGHEQHSHEHDGHNHEHDGTASANEVYDPKLAAKYKADDYGMGTYVIAFLKTGPNKSASDEEKAALQKAHMENINRLAEEGKLILAGPFFDDPEMRGIYIFDVETVEEARALTASDPMIQQGVLIMDLKKWYGSAAIRAVNELHHKVSKEII